MSTKFEKANFCSSYNIEYSMENIVYDRRRAAAYAKRWAFARNPAYYDFSLLGGDCTNFVSQCVYAGCGVMNHTPVTGWFYRNANDRTASWTGVEFFYNFFAANEGAGPFAEECRLSDLQIADVIQLGRGAGDFFHTLFVCGFAFGVPLVASHTFDAYGRPLTSYAFERLRALHILGARRN